MISLVVVFPLEPVTPTRVTDGSRPRCTRARSCSAASVSGTETMPSPCADGKGGKLAAAALCLRVGNQQRRGPVLGGRAEELVPVGAFTRQGDEERPRRDRARIHDNRIDS